jgi:hypothetical protein
MGELRVWSGEKTPGQTVKSGERSLKGANRGVIGCFMPKTLMQSVISELQKERKRLEVVGSAPVGSSLTDYG